MLRKLLKRLLAVSDTPREVAVHRELDALVRDIESVPHEDLDAGDSASAAGVRTAIAAAAGVVPCGTCGALAAPRGGHMSVHFPSMQSTRPCPASWPPATTRSKT